MKIRFFRQLPRGRVLMPYSRFDLFVQHLFYFYYYNCFLSSTETQKRIFNFQLIASETNGMKAPKMFCNEKPS